MKIQNKIFFTSPSDLNNFVACKYTVIKDNVKIWSQMITGALKLNKYNNLGKAARKVSKNYSWKSRIIKIINFQVE